MEAILERLKKEPSQVLIGRYLALVAELRDEREKQEQTLRLAHALVKAKPAEALRIAHMAHRADRTDPRPLDVMIASFEARGRFAKAEVLKIERAKLEKANATEMMPGGKKQHIADDLMSDAAALAAPADEMPPVQGLPAGAPPLPRGRGGPRIVFSTADAEQDGGPREDTKMAELDIGGDGPPAEYSALSMLFQDAEERAPAPAPAPVREVAPVAEPVTELPWRQPERSPFHSSAPVVNLDKVENVYSPPPSDDGLTAVLGALPQGQGPLGASPRPKRAEPKAEARSAPRHEAAPQPEAVFASMPQQAVIAGAAAQVPMRDTSAAAALFDHYWRAGRFEEARDLMHQTAAACAHESWWQGRRAALELADQQGLLDKKKPEDELPPATLRAPDVPPEERVPMAGDPFWQPLYAELNRLAKAGLVPPSASIEDTEKLGDALGKHPRGATLSKPFLAALAGIAGPHKGASTGKLRSLFWDLFQGLWGVAPDAHCAKALETLELTRLDPGFLGMYLDALIAAGRSRRALAFAREALDVNPHLAWARVVARRLAPIAKALGTEAVVWNEDEGVAALKERMAARAKPKLVACLAVGA